MIGAIIGDAAGSTFEFSCIKTRDIPLFAPGSEITDDSLLSIAIANAFLLTMDNRDALQQTIVTEMRSIGRAYPYPMGGYGSNFFRWLMGSDTRPYGSQGNGSAMRVSACGDIAQSLDEALALAKLSAEVTHSHPEGIRGAQATAAAIYLAKTGATQEEIRAYINQHFYTLTETCDEIRAWYDFDGTCQGTVPQAITAFLESTSFEDALRTAVSLGGDADTLTDITCAIAWPFYARRGPDKVMQRLFAEAMAMIPDELRDIVIEWEERYGVYDA